MENFIKQAGGWVREGIFYPHVAQVSEGRYEGLMAHYEPENIWGADFPDMGTVIYIMEVSIDGVAEKVMLPIFMFNFTKEQKDEIMVMKKNIYSNHFEIPGNLVYINSPIGRKIEEPVSSLKVSPPINGNHSSLIDDLNIGELIDEMIKLNEGL